MSSALIHETTEILKQMQEKICTAMEICDGEAHFREDRWDRPDPNSGDGGGGITRVLSGGKVFEKAGVNFSHVHGTLPADMCQLLVGRAEALPFEAVGTSLVIHPLSPMVPTIHANVRFITVAESAWFGGGIDLTPYVLFEEDVIHFHKGLKAICDRHNPEYYPSFKKRCDEYFYIKHRNECRGVGGIFFDYLGREAPLGVEQYKQFAYDVALGFNELYVPIVERRKELSYTEAQKRFQLLRRGRYVEFNLVYDRGTLFGLKTNGRIESILMSLPLHASWEYDYSPEQGTPEATLSEIFKNPREWV